MKIEVDFSLLNTLSPQELLLFSFIREVERRSPFGCSLTQTVMAQKLYLARSTVLQSMAKLRELGLIEMSHDYKSYMVRANAPIDKENNK